MSIMKSYSLESGHKTCLNVNSESCVTWCTSLGGGKMMLGVLIVCVTHNFCLLTITSVWQGDKLEIVVINKAGLHRNYMELRKD